MKALLKLRTITVLGLLVAGMAQAQTIISDPSSLLGPIGASRGAAVVASDLRHDSLFVNPASAAGSSMYSVSAVYGGVGDLMSASIVDTKSGPVGGGAFYLRRSIDPSMGAGFLGNYGRAEQQAGFALMGQISSQFSIGATGRYITDHFTSVVTKDLSEWEADLGARWTPMMGLNIGLAVRSVLEDKSGLYPTQTSLGVDYMIAAKVAVSASVTRTSLKTSGTQFNVALTDPSERNSYALGVEWMATDSISARGGMSFLNPWDQKIASVGLGYKAKSFEIDYAFASSVQGPSYLQHSVGLSLQL